MRRELAQILALMSAVVLAGCGIAAAPPTAKVDNSTSEGSLRITGYSPAAGAVTSFPTQVTIYFSEPMLDEVGLGALTLFTLNCGKGPFAAETVLYAYGAGSVAVTFATQDITSGTTCTLSVSSDMADENGNTLGGERTAAYTVFP